MTDYTNTYPDLVNVEDWLNASGYTGEAGACHQAMSLIRKQEKRIAELEAALKPFADCGVWDGYKDEEVFKLGFKIADLRAAAAALKETE